MCRAEGPQSQELYSMQVYLTSRADLFLMLNVTIFRIVVNFIQQTFKHYEFKGVFTPVLFGSTESNSSRCRSFGRVRIQQSHSGANQTTVPRPSWRGGLGLLPNELWYGWMDDLSTRVLLFTISASLAKRAVWKRTTHTHTHTHTKKSTLYLVRTKASELVDFPGVNTPCER